MLSNRPTDRHVILSDESYFSPEENKLRLKGTSRIRPVRLTWRFRRNKTLSVSFRANDLHGQLANDDVPGHARDAGSQRVGDHRPVHKRSFHARFQQVRCLDDIMNRGSPTIVMQINYTITGRSPLQCYLRMTLLFYAKYVINKLTYIHVRFF